MAPTKRKSDGKAENASENQKTTRVTRSSTRQATQGATKVVTETLPKAKKPKLTSKEKVESKPKTTEEPPLSDGVNGTSKTIVIEHWFCAFANDGFKWVTKEVPYRLRQVENEASNLPIYVGIGRQQPAAIECNQFKIRAVKVKLGLENAVSGITVLINPEKPRRGCFEIREEGGKKFISLLDMKRPFGPMKALDMDGVISDIVEQIK